MHVNDLFAIVWSIHLLKFFVMKLYKRGNKKYLYVHDQYLRKQSSLFFSLQKYIYQNCMIFIQLCVLKLEDDCLPLLEILGLLMNPSCR